MSPPIISPNAPIANAVSPTSYVEKMKTALVGFKKGARFRLDSWMNDVTGFGTGRDKASYGYLLPDRTLTDNELSAVYHSDDMAARMVDIVPQEMFREGFSIELGDNDLNIGCAMKMDEIGVREHMMDGTRWGRCYGGGAVLIGADDGLPSDQPLDPEQADDLSYLRTFDRRLLWPIDYYEDPASPKLGQPKSYVVSTYGSRTQSTTVVHESRLLIFRGAPTGIRERVQLASWDYSVLQRAYEVLRSFNTGWRAVETLLTDGNQAIFKMTGLSEILRSGGEELLRVRMQAMDLYRSMMRAMVIDADGKETFERQSANFSGIPDVLDKQMLRLAAAVQIPVTILMGQSPAGMNATGESDFRWFYDRIRSDQYTTAVPRIRRLVNVWLRTKAGQAHLGKLAQKGPPKCDIEFPVLWTDTPLVQAQRRLAIAQGDVIYSQQIQALTPEEIALKRFGSAKGFAQEIQLDDAGRAAREALLNRDLSKMGDDEIDPAMMGEGDMAPDESQVKATASLQLTASDLASIVKVNEARASVGLPPLPGKDGQLTLPQFKAKYASILATAANAEDGIDPNEKPEAPTLPPVPNMPALNAANHFDAEPRLFTLQRDEDETGVSGTGPVAQGVQFADGSVAMKWNTATSSTTIFAKLDDVIAVHGHGGRTRIIWNDGK